MSGGSSIWKGFGAGRGKGKGPPLVWDGSLGPQNFGEALDEFPVQCKSDFTREKPLRSYDKRKEEWPKCMHGEDCLVQMCDDELDGGRRFFKCPRAWSSDAPENCKFVRWVDPPPLHPYFEYIEYLQNRIGDLEWKLTDAQKGAEENEEDDNNSDGGSQDETCTDPYCRCPCHKNKGPSPSPPPSPPPPPAMGGYYGEGATQLNMWGHY